MDSFFKKKLFFISPIVVYNVSGKSMEPKFLHSQKLIVLKKWLFWGLKIDDVIVLINPISRIYILKRVKKIKGGNYFVLGDNLKESTDSRVFGWIKKNEIIGKVIFKS